jgi:hypothetical protein
VTHADDARVRTARINKARAAFNAVDWDALHGSQSDAKWAVRVYEALAHCMNATDASAAPLEPWNIGDTLEQLTNWRDAPPAKRGPIVVVVGNCTWVNPDDGRQETYGCPSSHAVSSGPMQVRG